MNYTSVFVSIIVLISTFLGGCDEESQSFSNNRSFSSICGAASAHVMACTGSDERVLQEGCDSADAQLLLDTPCDVLQQASSIHADQKADGTYNNQISYTCQWFGIGCPVDESCAPKLSHEAVAKLIVLSDVSTLVDEYDARYRIAQIADIIEAEPDPIGMFAIVYRHITNNAVESVENGMYVHPEWTRKLITAFARRYLVNLHGHLTQGEVTPQWTKYYKLARNCEVGRGRVLGVAIATHLIVDLTYALHDVESIAKHEDDYMLFGEISLWVFPDLVADIKTVFNEDVSRLLQGFFFGDWVDELKGKGAATTFIYQTVRANSWRNSQNLWSFPRWMVDADVASGWGMAEVSLAVLDATGAL